MPGTLANAAHIVSMLEGQGRIMKLVKGTRSKAEMERALRSCDRELQKFINRKLTVLLLACV